MKLVLFGVRDIVTNQTGFIFPAKNDKDLRRTIKGAIMSKSPVFSENMADKQILQVALLDTDTGVIVGEAAPVFICTVQEICDELLTEIKVHNEKMKAAGLPVADVPVDTKEAS